ncbi:MAG: GNAT family N-acetyltransferase [Intrasporangium sp.]|uniref:GNAT family N-acetyltransferase n=1 Tax=Intrasporangium sp. TaxID=1925024 RepID=UPI0026486DC7|nr:GNAT family N-acetyltransferase [Intrasporangium sp.]MDN5795712.1 GNAT family N-acetyltransferase [Intrasporangium sp.]
MSQANATRPVVVRPLAPGDTSTVYEVMDQLSARSVYLRFHAGMGRLKPRMAAALARVSAGDRQVLVARVDGHPVGLAHVARVGTEAEVALAVADAWQGTGIGRSLASAAAQAARGWGSGALVAVVLPEHRQLRDWLARLGAAPDRQDPMMLRVPVGPDVESVTGPAGAPRPLGVLEWPGAGPGARSAARTAAGRCGGRAAG